MNIFVSFFFCTDRSDTHRVNNNNNNNNNNNKILKKKLYNITNFINYKNSNHCVNNYCANTFLAAQMRSMTPEGIAEFYKRELSVSDIKKKAS